MSLRVSSILNANSHSDVREIVGLFEFGSYFLIPLPGFCIALCPANEKQPFCSERSWEFPQLFLKIRATFPENSAQISAATLYFTSPLPLDLHLHSTAFILNGCFRLEGSKLQLNWVAAASLTGGIVDKIVTRQLYALPFRSIEDGSSTLCIATQVMLFHWSALISFMQRDTITGLAKAQEHRQTTGLLHPALAWHLCSLLVMSSWSCQLSGPRGCSTPTLQNWKKETCQAWLKPLEPLPLASDRWYEWRVCGLGMRELPLAIQACSGCTWPSPYLSARVAGSQSSSPTCGIIRQQIDSLAYIWDPQTAWGYSVWCKIWCSLFICLYASG